MQKKRYLAIIMALAMAVSVTPMGAAAAETGTVPTVSEITVQKDQSTYTTQSNSDGSLYLSLPGETVLAGSAVTITTNTAVNFTQATDPAAGEMYVAAAGEGSAGLNIKATAGTIDLNGADYRLNLTSNDNVTWNGTVPSQYSVPVSALVSGLSGVNLGLRAASMTAVSGGAANPYLPMAVNADANSVLWVVCGPNQALTTVTFHYGDQSMSWKLPVGAPVSTPVPALENNQTLQGWYTDDALTQAVSASTVVTGNMDLYAKLETTSTTSTFDAELAAGAAVLNINNMDDWSSFVSKSAQITSSQRVELNVDIDCAGAAYTALTFAGNFDGNGKTISNATFNASGENSGLFAVIGPGQKVCNLTLSGLTVKSATYSGALAGSISGTEGNQALVQNVQVRGGSVNGRSAGGVAGYVFFADVRYCSSRTTTISGQANGAGIAGLSYGAITDCYTVCSPSAVPLLGKTGGIVGKNLESGVIEGCWCSFSTVAGQTEGGSESRCKAGVTTRTSLSAMTALNLDPVYWNVAAGQNSSFTEAVQYQF